MDRAFNGQNLKAALELASAGIAIFPSRVWWDEAAGKLAKQPMIVGWQVEATTDGDQIGSWWRPPLRSCLRQRLVPDSHTSRHCGLLGVP
jgi:hypothetical protein